MEGGISSVKLEIKVEPLQSHFPLREEGQGGGRVESVMQGVIFIEEGVFHFHKYSNILALFFLVPRLDGSL